MKHYIALIMITLSVVGNTYAGGELRQRALSTSDQKTAEALKKTTSPEYRARTTAKQAIDAVLQGDVSACTDLKTFIDSSARTVYHSTLKELEKNMTLCTLLNAFNVITKGHRLPQEATIFYEQFRTADEIIKTQVGKDGHHILDPDASIADKSLLHILLHKALSTDSYESFDFLLRLAKRLLDKKATVGPEESSLLVMANPKIRPADVVVNPRLHHRPIATKRLKDHIDMLKYRLEHP